jgi:prepilin-type N-terminal cleavage/methylation domain-containing protein
MNMKMLKRGRQFNGGFTLAELLAVIAIIGLLAALLFPALAMAKGYSRSVSCRNHLRQMGIALKMYVNEHNSAFPFYLGPAGPSYGDEKGGSAANLVYWSSKLFPYYPLNWTNSLFHCPAKRGQIRARLLIKASIALAVMPTIYGGLRVTARNSSIRTSVWGLSYFGKRRPFLKAKSTCQAT